MPQESLSSVDLSPDVRVVLVGFYPPPYGGESIHVRQLATFLARRGAKVQVLNLNRHAPSSSEYRSASGRWGRVRVLFSLLDPWSLLHLHAVAHNWKSWIVIFVTALIARLKGVPTMLTVHSGVFPDYVSRFGWMRRITATWVLQSFDRIVCVNQQILEAVINLHINATTAVVISPFLGVSKAPDLCDLDRVVLKRFHPLIVAVGGGDPDPELGLPVVVHACRGLLADTPSFGVIFLGWQVGRKIQPLIDRLGLAEHAVCLGEVPHEQCLYLIQNADVVVRSTFADGDSITVREALGLGVSVVASDTYFRPETVTLFRQGNAVDLLEKLKAALAQPARPSTPKLDGAESAERLWRIYLDLTRLRRVGSARPVPE